MTERQNPENRSLRAFMLSWWSDLKTGVEWRRVVCAVGLDALSGKLSTSVLWSTCIGISEAAAELQESAAGWENAARAVMTTDTWVWGP